MDLCTPKFEDMKLVFGSTRAGIEANVPCLIVAR